MKINSATMLILAMYAPVLAQVQQRRPDLCGSAGVTSLPEGVSAAVDSGKGEATLTVDRGGASVRLTNVLEIIQVCPLSDRRLVVFADPGFGFSVNIVDSATPALLDSFLTGYDPILSPDRRWLVYPKFSARYTELPASTEYLMYDLSRNPAQNRPSGKFSLSPLDVDVGVAIYPVGWKNEPGDNIGAPASQRHTKASAFFWSPDSHAIAFADFNPQGGQELVYVPIDAQGPVQPTVSPFPATVQCDDSKSRVTAPQPDSLLGIEFEPLVKSDRLLSVAFAATGCTPRPVQLHSESFLPVTRENRVQPKPALTYK